MTARRNIKEPPESDDVAVSVMRTPELRREPGILGKTDCGGALGMPYLRLLLGHVHRQFDELPH